MTKDSRFVLEGSKGITISHPNEGCDHQGRDLAFHVNEMGLTPALEKALRGERGGLEKAMGDWIQQAERGRKGT